MSQETQKICIVPFMDKINPKKYPILVKWFENNLHIKNGQLTFNKGEISSLPFDLEITIFGLAKLYKKKTVFPKDFLGLIIGYFL